MNDDQFTKLFKAIQAVDAKVDALAENMATKDDYSKMMNTVTDIAVKFADHDEDHQLTNRQLERQEKWAHMLAEKVKVDLSYES